MDNPLTTISPIIGTQNVLQITFSWYDYLFFCLMLAISAVIGIYFGCFGSKQATAEEYLMGDKKMKVFPIAVSLVSSHMSSIALLGVPADIYMFGATYWLIIFATMIGSIIAIYVYLPVFYILEITSTYEYLEMRFDSKNRVFASFIFALGLFMYLPIVIYTPALALSAATQISVHYISPVVCGVCIFYTTLGGLKAVVWTDTLQFTISTSAVLMVFILGLNSAGGFGPVWTKATEGHRLNIFDFDPDPTKRDSFWIVIIGLGTNWLSMVGVNQSCVQKYLSVPTLRQAKLSIIFFNIGIAIIISFSIFTGLMMYSKYADCDPFTTGAVQKSDQLVLYYIMDVASHIPGLSGIFIAGVFCSALSTLSASLNCVAGTVYEDFILKLARQNITKKSSSFILKSIVLIMGVICTALIFAIEHLGGILPLAIGFSGVTAGPLLGMFTLGLLFPKASRRGSLYGSIIGLTCTLFINIMAQYYQSQGLIVYEPKPVSVEGCSLVDNVLNNTLANYSQTVYSNLRNENENSEVFTPFFLFRISYYYYATLGFVVTIVIGLMISCFLKDDNVSVNPKLISPVVHFLLKSTKKEVNETI